MLRINQTKKCETKDSSLRINFVLEPRDQRFPGSLSLSRSVGRVGENLGNEIENLEIFLREMQEKDRSDRLVGQPIVQTNRNRKSLYCVIHKT